MSGGYLVDTNIVSAYFAGEKAIFYKFREAEILIPSPVVGEIFTWGYVPPLRRERLRSVRMLLSSVPVLWPDFKTGELFGRIYVDLEGRGRMIQQNDIWIAALALQHGYTVASRDSDFERVTGLKLEKW